jgi:glyoxylase-like metal-dependent hydrolase (beta-lactamase superfamily II)
MRLLPAGAICGPTIEIEPLGDGVTGLRMSSRVTRASHLEVSAFLVGDILVDSGFAFVRPRLVEALESTEVAAICLTHHHEDHAGNCGTIARAHGCPVYLSRPAERWSEGVARLAPYRRVYWGAPDLYEPLEMPPVVRTASTALEAVPTPGHSATHTALWDAATGTLLSGDLVVSPGVSAVMSHEDPYELIDSLRRAAALEPARMLPAHGPAVVRPAAMLRAKADLIEEAAARAVALHEAGVRPGEIVPRIFSRGRRKDAFMALLTGREFCRENFVRACLERRPGARLRKPGQRQPPRPGLL